MFHTGISQEAVNAEKADLLQCKIQLRCVQEGPRLTDLVPFISGLRALDVLGSLLSEPY